jgi:phosphomannomutase
VKCKLALAGDSGEPLRTLFRRWREALPPLTIQNQYIRLGASEAHISLEFAGNGLTLHTHIPPAGTHTTQAHHPELAHLWQRFDPDQVTVDTTDGIKLSTPNAWFSLRPSNTEPILRLMGEYRA